jgi:hypothetical protein
MAKSSRKLGQPYVMRLSLPAEIYGRRYERMWDKQLDELGYVHNSGPTLVIKFHHIGTVTYNHSTPRRIHHLGNDKLVRVYASRNWHEDISSVWLEQAGKKLSVKPLVEIFPGVWVGPLEDRGVPGTFFVPAVRVKIQY